VAFREELESVVAEIREEAVRRYEWDWEAVFSLDESGTRMVPPGPMDAESREVLQGRVDQFHSYLDSLEATFASFYDLNPVPVRLLVSRLGGGGQVNDPGDLSGDRLTAVSGRLHHADAEWVTPLAEPIESADTANHRFGYWSGPAATEFNNGFLAPFRAASERQIAYARLLAFSAQILHDGVAAAQDDLLAIARACRDQLRSYREGREFDAAGFFMVTGIAASAVALYPGLPVWAATTLGIGELGISLVSAAAGEDDPQARPEWAVTGSDAMAILASCNDQIVEMQEQLAAKDDEVAALLRAMTDTDPGDLSRPAVADAGAGFGTVDSIDQNVVVTEVQEIYRAGFVALPAAAEDYDRAHHYLSMHDEQPSVSRLFPRSAGHLVAARANLSSAVSRIRDSLEDAGQTLVRIAAGYEWSDATAADRFNQYRAGLEPAPPARDSSQRPVREVF
jgi:hypothetical protein